MKNKKLCIPQLLALLILATGLFSSCDDNTDPGTVPDANDHGTTPWADGSIAHDLVLDSVDPPTDTAPENTIEPVTDGGDGKMDSQPSDLPQPDTLSPDTVSPDTLSPDTLSPDTLSPDTLSPDTLSPDTLSPDTLSPDTAPPPGPKIIFVAPDVVSENTGEGPMFGIYVDVNLEPDKTAVMDYSSDKPGVLAIDPVTGWLTAGALPSSPTPELVTITATSNGETGTHSIIVEPVVQPTVNWSGPFHVEKAVGGPTPIFEIVQWEDPSNTLNADANADFPVFPAVPPGSFFTFRITANQAGWVDGWTFGWSQMSDWTKIEELWSFPSGIYDGMGPLCGETLDYQNKVDVEVYTRQYPAGWKLFISDPDVSPIYMDDPAGLQCAATETSADAEVVFFYNVDPGYHWVLATDGTSIETWLIHPAGPGSVVLYRQL